MYHLFKKIECSLFSMKTKIIEKPNRSLDRSLDFFKKNNHKVNLTYLLSIQPKPKMLHQRPIKNLFNICCHGIDMSFFPMHAKKKPNVYTVKKVPIS